MRVTPSLFRRGRQPCPNRSPIHEIAPGSLVVLYTAVHRADDAGKNTGKTQDHFLRYQAILQSAREPGATS